MNYVKACTLALLSTAWVAGAPRITKVEPPNWWIPHTRNHIQVLLSGRELTGAKVTTSSRGFRVEVRSISENGHYAFLYLDIGKDARPATHTFTLETPSGKTEFQFRLDRPLDAHG